MPKNTIEITLIASRMDGTLRALMRQLGSLGLIYLRSNSQEIENGVKLDLVCEGEVDCEKSGLVRIINEVSNVDSVISVIQSNDKTNELSDELQEISNELTELHPLRAHDAITHDVLHIVEDRLAETYGPSASLLLKSAAKKSSCVGDLFVILSKDLSDDKKLTFLKNVIGLDDKSLSEA